MTFFACSKDESTTEYDKGYKEGVSAMDYTSLIYDEQTASFSMPSLTVDNTMKIVGLCSLYDRYQDNSVDAEWKSGFKAGVASGSLGEEGATKLIAFFDSETTALAMQALRLLTGI